MYIYSYSIPMTQRCALEVLPHTERFTIYALDQPSFKQSSSSRSTMTCMSRSARRHFFLYGERKFPLGYSTLRFNVYRALHFTALRITLGAWGLGLVHLGLGPTCAWARSGLWAMGPWAHLGPLCTWAQLPLGLGTHLGPGTTWAQGRLGPGAHLAQGQCT